MNSAQFDGSCGKCVRVRGTEAGASGERDAAGPMPVLCLPAAAASPLIFQCKGGLNSCRSLRVHSGACRQELPGDDC